MTRVRFPSAALVQRIDWPTLYIGSDTTDVIALRASDGRRIYLIGYYEVIGLEPRPKR
jgi:hypothetical protein